MAVLEDPDGRWQGPQDGAAFFHAGFRPLAQPGLNAGLSDSVWWLRLDMDLPPDRQWLLEIGYTQNDRLDFFMPEPGRWRRIEAGDTRLRPSELLSHSHPVMVLPSDLRRELYLRIQSAGSVQVPVAVVSAEEFIERAGVMQFGYGMYFAVLLAMATYNLFLFFAMRNRAYLFYVGYLTGLVLFQGGLSGHVALWLWPHWPLWGHFGTVAGVALTLVSGAGFVGTLAETRQRAPGAHRLLWILALGAVLVVPLLALDYRVALLLAAVLGLISITLVFPLAAILSYWRGCRQARFLVLGVLLFLPGVIGVVLRTLGVLPMSWWSEHFLQLGTAVEAMLFSFALADRINALHGEKLAAQKAVVSAHDSERRRIARDLHDGLGQNLLLLGGKIRRLARQPDDSGTISQALDNCIAELRSASRDLYPHQLDRLGLEDALRSMLDQATKGSGLAIDKCLEPPRLSPQQALHIYRIVQEAISNILRHADASHACVHLVAKGRDLSLIIEDNGQGFDWREIDRGLGLTGMRSRAEILGGHLRVDATPDSGTRIELKAPWRHD